MKKTGLYVALGLSIPLGILAVVYDRLWTCVFIGGIFGLAAALYDTRANRG